jgi:hypothetical protein
MHWGGMRPRTGADAATETAGRAQLDAGEEAPAVSWTRIFAIARGATGLAFLLSINPVDRMGALALDLA